MKNGWFIGAFEPTFFYTDRFEVAFATYKKGQKWDVHYHKKATEINLLVEGKMMVQGKELNAGQGFVFDPYEISDPVYLEDCKIIVVKDISDLNDKYVMSTP